MEESSISLYPFEQWEHEGFEDEPPMSCFLGKVVYFGEGRNAYYGYWSSTYPGNAAFSLDVAEVKRRIEGQRVQGSQWTIEELPVLVVAGRDNSLVIGEINTTEPLKHFLRLRKLSRSLEALGDHFKPLKANSVFRFLCKRSLMVPAQLPFYEYRSVSHGGNVALRWSSSVSGIKIEPTLQLVLRVNKLLHAYQGTSIRS